MEVLKKERILIVNYLKKLALTGLGGGGTSGNISIKSSAYNLLAISPSGVGYDELTWEMVPVVERNGNLITGNYKPSSEMPFHLEIYNTRSDVNAVVHTHSINAAAFSTLGFDLPALHYIIGYAGNKVPHVPYKTFGGEELASAIGDKIKDYNGVILGNHGVVAVGENIEIAFACAESIEFVSEIYFKTHNIPFTPNILSADEMSIVLEKFKTYGQGKN